MDNLYIAGLFDGEGFIVIPKGKPRIKNNAQRSPQFSLRIGVEMINKNQILDKLYKTFGGHLYKRPGRRAENRQVTTLWYEGGDNAMEILKKIIPHLIIKKEQAEIAIKFQEHMKKHRLKFPRKQRLGNEIIEFRQECKDAIQKLNGVYPLKK